jgi:membrane protease YdiL (CAAX protease family)
MSNAVMTALIFLPFILILWLANLADRRRLEGQKHPLLAALAYGLLGLLYAALILVGLLLFVLGDPSMPLAPQLAYLFYDLGIGPDEAQAALTNMGLGLWLPALIGIFLLLRPIRRILARIVPIDPLRTVHAVALSYVALIAINLLLTLAWGVGNLATLMEASPQDSHYGLILSIWAQESLWAVTALLGVGWLSRRSLAQALRRLGVVRPSLRQVGLGLAVGLVLVPVILLVDQLAGRAGLSSGEDVGRLTDVVIGPLFRSLTGVLTVGLAAALGEETVFRGALQPRFGLPLTALLFALLHSNYGLSLSTVVVLFIGLVLGLLRRRANATTSMVAHAIYNSTLGLLVYLGFL